MTQLKKGSLGNPCSLEILSSPGRNSDNNGVVNERHILLLLFVGPQDLRSPCSTDYLSGGGNRSLTTMWLLRWRVLVMGQAEMRTRAPSLKILYYVGQDPQVIWEITPWHLLKFHFTFTCHLLHPLFLFLCYLCSRPPMESPDQEKQPGTKQEESTLESERPGFNSKLYSFSPSTWAIDLFPLMWRPTVCQALL